MRKLLDSERESARRLLDEHYLAEDTDTDAEGNKVVVQFCADCDDSWPCDTATVAEGLLEFAANAALAREQQPDARDAQRYLEDLTPGGSEYFNNPKRCYEWAVGRIESSHRIAMNAALERNRLRERVGAADAEISRLTGLLVSVADATMPDGIPCWCLNDGYWDGDHTDTCRAARAALAAADPPAPEQGAGGPL